MNYYNNLQTTADQNLIDKIVQRNLRNSLLWMVWGLFTTLFTAVALLMEKKWLLFAHDYFQILLFVELAVVVLFSARQRTASITSLKAMFFSYSILNGLTLTVIALHYSFFAVSYAFMGTLAFFISFAIVGNVVKKDLTSLSSYLFAAVLAMILVGIFNIFIGGSNTISLVLGIVGVIVFAIFTAVDINRLRQEFTLYALEDETVLERIGLMGALSLYLDFINLFLSLLRIFGRKN